MANDTPAPGQFVLGHYEEDKMGCMVYFSTNYPAEAECMRQRLYRAINKLNRTRRLDPSMKAEVIKAYKELDG